jgi:hypothetical protein
MDSGQTKRERRRMMSEQNNLLNELPLIEDRLRRAGLLATAVKMNEAVKSVGWETAELREKWSREDHGQD